MTIHGFFIPPMIAYAVPDLHPAHAGSFLRVEREIVDPEVPVHLVTGAVEADLVERRAIELRGERPAEAVDVERLPREFVVNPFLREGDVHREVVVAGGADATAHV